MFGKLMRQVRPHYEYIMGGDIISDIIFILKFYWITLILFGVVIYIPYTITANLFIFLFTLF